MTQERIQPIDRFHDFKRSSRRDARGAMSAARAPVSDRVDRARDRGEPSARAEDASAARRPRYELTTRARADIAFETFDALARRARASRSRGTLTKTMTCARRVGLTARARCDARA